MINFPKLRYPIHTRGLQKEDELILLAYDALFRARNLVIDCEGDSEFSHDLDANLSNLGHHIEKNICGFDLALRFEGFEDSNGVDAFPSPPTSGEMKHEFVEIVKKELEK